eukprot:scaffold19625_cov102-Isochrysis_galbana.AAC.2
MVPVCNCLARGWKADTRWPTASWALANGSSRSYSSRSPPADRDACRRRLSRTALRCSSSSCRWSATKCGEKRRERPSRDRTKDHSDLVRLESWPSPHAPSIRTNSLSRNQPTSTYAREGGRGDRAEPARSGRLHRVQRGSGGAR